VLVSGEGGDKQAKPWSEGQLAHITNRRCSLERLGVLIPFAPLAANAGLLWPCLAFTFLRDASPTPAQLVARLVDRHYAIFSKKYKSVGGHAVAIERNVYNMQITTHRRGN
jgi:hypothetical protein